MSEDLGSLCLIPSNPDVAGIGVRISIYIQAFLSILSATLRQAVIKYQDDLEKHENRMADSAIILLVTGIALVVSGIIQATLYGLTVYHAFILIALSGLTVLAAIPPYIIIASKIFMRFGRRSNVNLLIDFINEPRKRWLVVLHSLHLSFTAAFGIWLFTRIQTFDTTPGQDCTSSTVLEIVGHTWPVLDPLFRRLGLALVGFILLPPLNLTIITATFGLASLLLVSLPLNIYITTSLITPTTLRTLTALSNGIPPFVMAVLIVISVEETINANTVAPGQTQWTLGQTLALFVSLIPLYDLIHWLFEEVHLSNRGPHDASSDSEAPACTRCCGEHCPPVESTGRTEVEVITLGAIWAPPINLVHVVWRHVVNCYRWIRLGCHNPFGME